MDRILSHPLPESVSEEEYERRLMVKQKSQRQSALVELLRVVGDRYERCTLDNFSIEGADDVKARKNDAIAKVNRIAGNLDQHQTEGGNVIFYGPPGTGKDHLLVGLMREAILHHGMSVHWCNGQTLFGDFRDNIDRDISERQLLAKYSKPSILAISDPVPPRGEISNYASAMLYRIIDERYRFLRSTWVTVNVATSEEAAQALSGPILDRLRDTAVTVFCNWPSYRVSRKPEWMK